MSRRSCGRDAHVDLLHEVLPEDVLRHRGVREPLDEADALPVALVDDQDGLVNCEALSVDEDGERDLRVAWHCPRVRLARNCR